MPREKGFMGLGDNRSDDEAFKEGRRESRKSGLGDDFGRKMNQTRERFTESILGRDPRSSQEKAYDAGWEKGKKDRPYYEKPKPRKKKSKTNYSSGGGGGGSIDYGYGDSEGGLAGGLIVLAILGIGVILCATNLTKIEQWVSSGSPIQKNTVINQQQNSFSAPVKKEVNCADIIKKRKAGKRIKLPAECKDFNQSTQQINQTDSQANKTDSQTPPGANHQITETQNQQRAKNEQQSQIEQQRIESERQEQIRQQESDERARDFVRRREEERRQAEAERLNEEQAERKRQQAREEYARQQKETERRQQEKNERIIRQGIEIRNKIFKKH